jgi:hypothetical protein
MRFGSGLDDSLEIDCGATPRATVTQGGPAKWVEITHSRRN